MRPSILAHHGARSPSSSGRSGEPRAPTAARRPLRTAPGPGGPARTPGAAARSTQAVESRHKPGPPPGQRPPDDQRPVPEARHPDQLVRRAVPAAADAGARSGLCRILPGRSASRRSAAGLRRIVGGGLDLGRLGGLATARGRRRPRPRPTARRPAAPLGTVRSLGASSAPSAPSDHSRGRDGLAALGRLPDHLAGLVLDPLALGPLLAGVARLLLGQLGLALDVDPPAGQPGRQAGVLPLLADGQRQLVVADDDGRGARLVVEADLSYPGRLQGALDRTRPGRRRRGRCRPSRRGARWSPCAPGRPGRPTQAPTGSTLGSFDHTAILVRCPGSRAAALISTTPEEISGHLELEEPLDEARDGSG